jgi:asparaginyl-tRNA synthetase
VGDPSSSAAPKTEFFGSPAYLTVSSQLHLEALAASLARVYAITPCFRAEPSQTSRHLAEFWMLEAELSFIESIDEVCTVVEDAVKHVLRTVLEAPSVPSTPVDERRVDELRRAAIVDKPWTRMTYTDAVEQLTRHHTATPDSFDFAPAWGKPLQSEHERWLADTAGGPVFVTDYPALLKPFYMRGNANADSSRSTVACFDLLVPGIGELAGGSLREERLDFLEDAIARHELDPLAYAWYLDLRRHGTAPHGGFGLGFERLISWVSGVENVRECIPMPRWAGRMLL